MNLPFLFIFPISAINHIKYSNLRVKKFFKECIPMAIDKFWGGKSHIALGVWPVVGPRG